MTEQQQIRDALWKLIKTYQNQSQFCKAHNIKSLGQLNQVLSGKIPPSDRYCRMVGWTKYIKYEKLEPKA